ncbi:MAG: hypothetical protein JWR30_2873, partial [Conexibacter sp.]|nr:hypothetical protein [Conexibacter sp.]
MRTAERPLDDPRAPTALRRAGGP